MGQYINEEDYNFKVNDFINQTLSFVKFLDINFSCFVNILMQFIDFTLEYFFGYC